MKAIAEWDDKIANPKWIENKNHPFAVRVHLGEKNDTFPGLKLELDNTI